jgi:hypothetical protein
MDSLWTKDPLILFREDRFLEFFVTKDMSFEEKLNAMVRLSIIVGILTALYNNDPKFLIIPAFVAAFTYFLTFYSKENYTPGVPSTDEDYTGPTAVPTESNPFMNKNFLDKKQLPAPNYHKIGPESEKIKKDIEEKFYKNLYQDVDDIFQTNNSRRQFFTVPDNNSVDFAKALYGKMKSGKEDQYFNGTNLYEPLKTYQR